MFSGILILAAGSSQRFGGEKRQATLTDGTTLLETTTRNALASGLPVAICLRPGDSELASSLEALGTQPLFCPNATRGMGHSLADGIARLAAWEGVLITLGDMPFIKPATFCNAASALVPGGICQPDWQGKPGHPVGFSATWFDALTQLKGDAGARDIIKQNGEAVTRFPVDDRGILRDIDTPADLPA